MSSVAAFPVRRRDDGPRHRSGAAAPVRSDPARGIRPSQRSTMCASPKRRNGPIQRPVDPAYIWGAALEEWSRARPDLRIINLETSITRSEDFDDKGINYRMSPENAECLAAAGIDCCVLANNHVLDWGRDGLTRNAWRRCSASRSRPPAPAAIWPKPARPAILPIAGKGRVLVFSFALADSGMPRSWAAKPDAAGVSFLADLSEASADHVCERDRAGTPARRCRRRLAALGPQLGLRHPRRANALCPCA